MRGTDQKARRPVLYAGGGVIISDAAPELQELAESANTGYYHLMGMGAFP